MAEFEVKTTAVKLYIAEEEAWVVNVDGRGLGAVDYRFDDDGAGHPRGEIFERRDRAVELSREHNVPFMVIDLDKIGEIADFKQQIQSESDDASTSNL